MEKIKTYLIPFNHAGSGLTESLLRSFNDLFSRQVLNSAGLTGGAVVTVATVNAISYVIAGVTAFKAASTLPALTGYNLTVSQIGGFVVTIDGGGNFNLLTINPAATLGSIGYPAVPPSQTVVGVILINAVNPASFIGGTTLTNSTSITYINQVGPFYPTNAF